MPNLKSVIESPSAMADLLDEMSQPQPLRAEPVLNHGIRNFDELAKVVRQPPFVEDDDRELAQVYVAARRISSP